LHHPVLIEDEAAVDQVADALARIYRHAAELAAHTGHLPDVSEDG
jgi:hypothetical protein